VEKMKVKQYQMKRKGNFFILLLINLMNNNIVIIVSPRHKVFSDLNREPFPRSKFLLAKIKESLKFDKEIRQRIKKK
jgi:hypothetical protein